MTILAQSVEPLPGLEGEKSPTKNSRLKDIFFKENIKKCKPKVIWFTLFDIQVLFILLQYYLFLYHPATGLYHKNMRTLAVGG